MNFQMLKSRGLPSSPLKRKSLNIFNEAYKKSRRSQMECAELLQMIKKMPTANTATDHTPMIDLTSDEHPKSTSSQNSASNSVSTPSVTPNLSSATSSTYKY